MDRIVGGAVPSVPVPPQRISAQAAIAELGQVALARTDVSSVFESALELVAAVLTVDHAVITRHVEDDLPPVVVAAWGGGGGVAIDSHRRFGAQSRFTLRQKTVVVVDNYRTEQPFDVDPPLGRDAVECGMSVAIPGRSSPFGVLAVHSTERRIFAPDEIDFLKSVANILGGAVQNEESRRELETFAHSQQRRLRYQEALAECAQKLLASTGEDRLQHAVEALLAATQASHVFVERNVVDPQLGFCSETVAEAEEPDAPGRALRNEYWDLVPWDRMPISRRHLEVGEPFILVPSELQGVEYELYANDPFPIKCELDIPIFVDGEWAGLVGFADSAIDREWTDEDISLLTTAATMIGAFWEREDAKAHLRKLIRSKDDFLASVSHELRTPLTAVIGFGQLLNEDRPVSPDDDRWELLESLLNQGTDIAHIVEDLLVAARANIGTLNVSELELDLYSEVQRVVEAFAHDERTAVTVSGGPVAALGDPPRIRQIIRNLVSNAFRHGGPHIGVRIDSAGEYARLVVADDGKGVPESDRERIFEPYERAHDERGVTGSIGLGLSISRELARLMGGDLTYSQTAGWSSFELRLPGATSNPRRQDARES